MPACCSHNCAQPTAAGAFHCETQQSPPGTAAACAYLFFRQPFTFPKGGPVLADLTCNRGTSPFTPTLRSAHNDWPYGALSTARAFLICIFRHPVSVPVFLVGDAS